MEWIASPEAWVALATLTVLEIVLGIDNIIFISILVGRLPESQRQTARIVGLSIAMGMRILLLLLITWIMKLQSTLFTLMDVDISGRDLILIGGGLFLIAKATLEIHSAVEGSEGHKAAAATASFTAVMIQIGVIDIVFSLDSVITAVGMADDVEVMIIAVVVAVIVMMFSAASIGQFVDDHPTIKMLALSFLVLIGVALVAEGIDLHIPKGYIYFAMAFSVMVELLNLKVRGRGRPVPLHKRTP
jgi:predicted tellurium resistance membrane protein TerC